MALKAYYDGSGKANNKAHGFLTLAGLAGDAEAWGVFDEQWRKTLASHVPSAAYLHMKEAMHLRGGFGRNGWTEQGVRSLLADLANHCFFKTQLGVFSCTVDLLAFRQLKEGLTIARAEEACTDGAVGLMLTNLGADPSERIEMYFDRKESFRGRVESIWKRQRRRAWWADRVDMVAPVDMKSFPGVQAADFIAWSLNRKYTVNDKPLPSMIHGLMARKVHAFFDREKLLKRYAHQEVTRGGR